MIIPDINANEALLEMLYFDPFNDMFENVFGRSVIKLYKPSQQTETWIGYDQGWVSSRLNQDDFEAMLKGTLHHSGPAPSGFVGYFIQFKCVRPITKFTPSRYDTHNCPQKNGIAPPCFRAEVSAKRSKKTSRSQHETLRQLSAIGRGIQVYYAFPCILGWADIDSSVRLDKLQIADVSDAPDYQDEDIHNAWFKNIDDDVLWCSKGRFGAAVSGKNWKSSDTVEFPKLMKGETILDWLDLLKENNIGLPPQFTIWALE